MTRSIQGIAAIALLALFAGSTPAAHAEGDKVTPVRSEKLPNVPGKSVTTVLVNYAPGGKSVSLPGVQLNQTLLFQRPKVNSKDN